MRQKLLTSCICAVAGAALVTGCVERTVYVQRPPLGEVVVNEPPPPPQTEVVVEAPGPGYAWVPGYWTWQGSWVWVRGGWRTPPHPRSVWVGGHWHRRGHGYVWIQGG